ncbi:MAG: tetratricopeptide repeat protein, partial [Cyanobacteria bacterium REEB65]|nr:tetratricopeptide repeat protein [Cyanobacteria bacterium REEB65]
HSQGLELFTALARHFAERTESAGDVQTAVQWWQLALKQNSNDSDLMRHLARAKVKIGDLEGAAGTYERVLTLDPTNLDVVHLAADTYRQLGEMARAEAMLDRVVELDPEHVPTLRALLQLAKDRRDSVAVMKRAFDLLDLDPKDPEALYCLARSHDALLERTAALMTFEELLEQAPKHAPSWHQVAILHRDMGNLEPARKAATNAIVYGPRPEYHVTLGTVLGQQGRWEEAVAAFNQALVMQPDHPAAMAQLGFGLLELNKPDMARPHFERAVALLPRGHDLTLSVHCALDRL